MEVECLTVKNVVPDFWALNCVGSDSDPFDPADDIDANMLMFTATNTTSVDLGIGSILEMAHIRHIHWRFVSV